MDKEFLMREYYSAIKNENAICSNMDGPRDYHAKQTKSEENDEYYYVWLMTYVYNLKILQVNLFTKYLEIDSDIENKLVVNKGEGGEG